MLVDNINDYIEEKEKQHNSSFTNEYNEIIDKIDKNKSKEINNNKPNENQPQNEKENINEKVINIEMNIEISNKETSNSNNEDKKDETILQKVSNYTNNDKNNIIKAKNIDNIVRIYRADNLMICIKRIIVNELFDFINKKIKEIYNNDIGKGLVKKELKKLSQEQIVNTRLNDNIEFLDKTLENIFSEKITKRLTNFLSSRNKEIIQELKREKDIEKKEYFDGLFSLTFLDCIKYFRGEVENDYIKGLKRFSGLINEYGKFKEKGDKYIESLKVYLDNYENILMGKKSKKIKNGK
jgi:hypothetical protein